MPGHSPGSIGLLERDLRVMVTGDTLYRTDEELIDWYPSSSVSQMAESVERIEALAAQGDLDLVLPGHNEVMEGREGILRQTRSHLAKVSPFCGLIIKLDPCISFRPFYSGRPWKKVGQENVMVSDQLHFKSQPNNATARSCQRHVEEVKKEQIDLPFLFLMTF